MGMTWQPIETAREHEVVLVGKLGEFPRVAVLVGPDRWAMVETQGGYVPYHPTHWQPLPEPPK